MRRGAQGVCGGGGGWRRQTDRQRRKRNWEKVTMGIERKGRNERKINRETGRNRCNTAD